MYVIDITKLRHSDDAKKDNFANGIILVLTHPTSKYGRAMLKLRLRKWRSLPKTASSYDEFTVATPRIWNLEGYLPLLRVCYIWLIANLRTMGNAM